MTEGIVGVDQNGEYVFISKELYNGIIMEAVTIVGELEILLLNLHLLYGLDKKIM